MGRDLGSAAARGEPNLPALNTSMKLYFILSALMLFSGPAQPASIQKVSSCESSYLTLEKRKNYYSLSDSRYEHLGVRGTLSSFGELRLEIYTKSPTGERSPLLRGSEGFDRIMKYFGDRVKTIEANWQTSLSGNALSDNLATVNKLTKAGVPLEEAVKQTWTAKKAAEFNFTEIEHYYFDGEPGNYSYIDVTFSKPQK